MDLAPYSPDDVREIIHAKGVTEVHHANSVATTCQFLRNRTLISRGSIERKGLYQTPQVSDELDRRHGIWFDVFVDSVDIHARAGRQNVYGPALLVFDIDFLKEAYPGQVWVTRLNPTKWDGRPVEERWFTSKEILQNGFTLGEFDQMIVFRNCGGELPLLPHIREIVLDDPQMQTPKDDVDFYSAALGALRLAMFQGGVDIPIRKRVCRLGCTCTEKYKADAHRTLELFSPRNLGERVLQPA